MTSREIVRRAIEFDQPPRIPYMFTVNPSRSDVGYFLPFWGFNRMRKGGLGTTYTDRWGVTWEVTGRAWDHSIDHPLADLSKLSSYRFPRLPVPDRRMMLLGLAAHRRGKYVLGVNPIMMVETLRALMGFEELLMASHLQPDGLLRVLERLTDLTVEVVEHYAQSGITNGMITYEDWGLQSSLQMKIDTFREFYKPSYRRVIDACHQHGMHFFWHSCGFIKELFPDMIDLGVDVVQLDQPRLTGHKNLIDTLGGKICMWNPVDIQWSTAPGRTLQEIRDEVAEMVRIYDIQGKRGGFMARHYPQPWDIGLSREKQLAIHDAFMENGCRMPSPP